MKRYPSEFDCRALLIAVALVSLPHAWHLAWPIFGFFGLLWLWRAAGMIRPNCLPGKTIVLVLTLAGFVLLISQQRSLFGRDGGTSLLVIAFGLKLMEMQTKREQYLIAYLVFIVAASQFLYQQNLAMAVYIGFAAVAVLAAIALINTAQIGMEQAVRQAGVLSLQAIPLAVVVFALFPRLEAPHWLWLADDSQVHRSGLSDTLEPGAIGALSLSGELAFRVRFTGEIPPPAERYWRGLVYSRTDGLRWFAGNEKTLQPESIAFNGKRYQYTLLMEPQQANWVFALEMPEAVDAQLQMNSAYQLVSSNRPGQRAEYRLVSGSVYNTGGISDAERTANLQLPRQISKRLIGLAGELKGADSEPDVFIRNVLQYFHQQDFHYTLTPPLLPDSPVDAFLFETRSGFCSHYATAFVYLLRIAGIPARVVGGYQGGEFNHIGGFWEIRQADAHAWAEAWLEGKGWVRFDPTAAVAPERIERGINVEQQIASGGVRFGTFASDSSAVNWLKRGRQVWQSIDYNWQRWVVNYHGTQQMQLFRKFGIVDQAALFVGMLVGLMATTLPLAWWLRRRRAAKVDESVKYYRRFCAKLARAGLVMELGEAPLHFAQRAKAARPDLTNQIDQITAAFIRLRYQKNGLAGDLRTLKDRVASLRI